MTKLEVIDFQLVFHSLKNCFLCYGRWGWQQGEQEEMEWALTKEVEKSDVLLGHLENILP